MPIEFTRISCSACGGNLQIVEGNKFCYCVYCGAAYYVNYGDATQKVSNMQAPQMRPINAEERMSRDFEIAKNNTLSNFMYRAIDNYELLDEGYCSNTPHYSRIYTVVRNGRLFFIEQISQFHIFEGKLEQNNNGFLLRTNYLSSLNLRGKPAKKQDIISCSKDYSIIMNEYGRLSLESDAEIIEIRLCAHYFPEYRDFVKIIENSIQKL